MKLLVKKIEADMMKGIQTFFIFLFVFSFYGLRGQNDLQIPEKVILALKNGNAHELAFFFGNTLELTILNKEEVYSKSQAEIILKDFFRKNPPDEFELVHQGNGEKTVYAIGNLTCSTKTYRIYFLLKQNYSRLQMHQLRIETE